MINVPSHTLVDSLVFENNKDVIDLVLKVDEAKAEWDFTEALAIAVANAVFGSIEDESPEAWTNFMNHVNKLNESISN